MSRSSCTADPVDRQPRWRSFVLKPDSDNRERLPLTFEIAHLTSLPLPLAHVASREETVLFAQATSPFRAALAPSHDVDRSQHPQDGEVCLRDRTYVSFGHRYRNRTERSAQTNRYKLFPLAKLSKPEERLTLLAGKTPEAIRKPREGKGDLPLTASSEAEKRKECASTLSVGRSKTRLKPFERLIACKLVA